MATYANTVKTARLDATRLEFVNGTLEIQSAGGDALVIYTLSASAGSVTTDVWTLAFTSTAGTGTVTAGAGTNATQAVLKNSGGTALLTGLTVGTSGTDIIIDNVNIAENQAVNIVGSPTITHAA